jgi:2-C-methyl-D-erythritol 4-phosphate cytidylyltransferase
MIHPQQAFQRYKIASHVVIALRRAQHQLSEAAAPDAAESHHQVTVALHAAERELKVAQAVFLSAMRRHGHHRSSSSR